MTVYDDFAHHPTAVAETLAGLRASQSGRRGSGPCSSRARPRRAGASSRTTSRAPSRAPTRSLLAPVFRSTLPEAERLSVPQLVRDLQRPRPVGARGRRRSTTSSPTIVGGASARRSRRPHVERRLRRHPQQAAARRSAVSRRSRIVARRRLGAGRRVRGAHRSRRQRAGDRAGRGARRRRGSAGVRDVVPTYRSVAVYFDPLRTDYDALDRASRARGGGAPRPAVATAREPIRIPVCYGGDVRTGSRRGRRVRRHDGEPRSSRVHAGADVPRVHARVRARLCVHGHRRPADRRAAPRDAARPRVPPARSASPACRPAIYPAETPGGWQLDRPHAAEAVRSVARRAVSVEGRRRRAVLPDRAESDRVSAECAPRHADG